MNCNLYQPNKSLSNHVKLMWSMEYDRKPENYCTQRILPTGCVELLFNFGENPIQTTENSKSSSQSFISISGQKTRFVDLQLSGNVGFILVMLYPDTARSILGVPVNELYNLQVGAEDIFGKEANQLYEKILEAKENNDKVRIIERFLLNRIQQNGSIQDQRVKECVRQISLSGGTDRICNLADNVNISRRQLERIFTANVGMTPKEFSKIIRFQHMLAVKQRDTSTNLTGLAYENGFSDQTHFIKDFKSITGYKPKEYFAKYPAFSDYYTYL